MTFAGKGTDWAEETRPFPRPPGQIGQVTEMSHSGAVMELGCMMNEVESLELGH